MALHHDHEHDHDEQVSSWPDDDPCCPDEPGVRIRAITFAELDDYLEQLTNPQGPAPLVGSYPGRHHDAGFLDGNGRPGASAMAQYRRRRATDRHTWQAALPQRLAGVLAAGVAAALATAVVAGPGLTRFTGPAAAVGLAWLLRFRPSPATLAWRHGAEGERRTARLLAPLERHGYQVFHDLAIPGAAANVDHLVIGPTEGLCHRLQTLPRPPALHRRAPVAWQPDPGPDPGDAVVGGHPGRRDPRLRPRPARLPGAVRPRRPAVLAP
jgi:nuclease-like protein